MKKTAATLLAIVLFPLLAWAAAELKGTVVKVDKAQNDIVVWAAQSERDSPRRTIQG